VDTRMEGIGVRAPAEGTDHVCDTCGCEIMVKHSGDHRLHASDHYICRCGTPMRLEHATVGEPA
jgi:hypothetical protein